MPVDPRLWLDAPPRSSYPACQAVKAAAEQDLDGPYLRVVREGLMVDRRTLDSPDALIDAARRVPGMDVERFAIDLRSNAITESFGADLERVRAAAPHTHTEGRHRVPFPSFEFRAAAGGEDAAPAGVYDSGDVEQLRRAAIAAGAAAGDGLSGRRGAGAALRPAGHARGRGGIRPAGPARGGRAVAAGHRMARAPGAGADRRAVVAGVSGLDSVRSRSVGGEEQRLVRAQRPAKLALEPGVELAHAALADAERATGLGQREALARRAGSRRRARGREARRRPRRAARERPRPRARAAGSVSASSSTSDSMRSCAQPSSTSATTFSEPTLPRSTSPRRRVSSAGSIDSASATSRVVGGRPCTAPNSSMTRSMSRCQRRTERGAQS